MNGTIIGVLLISLFIIAGAQIGCLIRMHRRISTLIANQEKKFEQIKYGIEQGSIDLEEYIDDKLNEFNNLSIREQYEEDTDDDGYIYWKRIIEEEERLRE